MLLGVSDVVAAVGFALFGPVHWTAALPLAVGLLAGSLVGPTATAAGTAAVAPDTGCVRRDGTGDPFVDRAQ